jgi:hypothetical protein
MDLVAELERQGVEDYKLWPGVYFPSVKKSINLAHKQIVEWAYENDLDEVCIAEDDLLGTSQNSWKFFLENKPKEFDIYLSSVFLGDFDNDNKVEVFTGMTLYIVRKKFYPKFLTIPDDEHIDHALGGLGDFRVCNPFTFIQRDGVSGNTGKREEYSSFFRKRQLYLD